MSRRSALFSRENLLALPLHSPFLLLFAKQDWQEYLELLARLYDLIEEHGHRVDFDLARALIDAFFSQRELASVMQKRGQFVSMMIAELGLLRDTHDPAGKRFLEPTREGRALLKLCEGLLLNRRKFTGTGADTLLGSLNSLLSAHSRTVTLEEAVAEHRKRINELEEDIARMKEHGVQASELLSQGFSAEELFTQAEEAASSILAAGEDVKIAIENARRELVQSYRKQDFTVGQAIEYVADFHESLRASPEYASFIRAKDILSFIEGLGGRYEQKDVTRIFQRLRGEGLVEGPILTQSALGEFPRRFQGIVRDIEEKIREQLSILRTQVHYAVMAESRRTQVELSELMGLLTERSGEALSFSAARPYSVRTGLGLELGAVRPHDLVWERDEVVVDTVAREEIGEEEMDALAEMLRKAEEATIARVITRLLEALSRHGEVTLSQYELRHGLIEFYVLARIENFHQGIVSLPLGRVDLPFRAQDREYVLRRVKDRRISFTS